MVEVIERGEPAIMVGHWTGMYWNGQELGFKIMQEVTRRLAARFDHLLWMKLSEVSRYWAARQLTRVERDGNRIAFHAPFACRDYTVRFEAPGNGAPHVRTAAGEAPLKEVAAPLKLEGGTWCREGQSVTACFALERGGAEVEMRS